MLPAVERYNGPEFRVLRRYLQTKLPDPPDVYVLSAELGLIPSHQPVALYDRRMTAARAQDLRPSVAEAFERLLRSGYCEIFVSVGRDYRAALDEWNRLISGNTIIHVAMGSRGERLFALRKWLYGSVEGDDEDKKRDTGPARLRGVTLSLGPEEIYAIARRVLDEGKGDLGRDHIWRVVVDGQPIGVKRLVSELTGLPVGAFGTFDARHVLTRLGVKIVST